MADEVSVVRGLFSTGDRKREIKNYIFWSAVLSSKNLWVDYVICKVPPSSVCSEREERNFGRLSSGDFKGVKLWMISMFLFFDVVVYHCFLIFFSIMKMHYI